MSGGAPGLVPTLVDGESVGSLSVTDRGFAYGDGLFETIRVTAQGPVLYGAHLRRLLRSSRRLSIPLDTDQVHTFVTQLLHAAARIDDSTFADGIIKLIVTRGDGGRGYTPPISARARIIVQWHSLPLHPAANAGHGIDCALIDQPVSVNPALAGMKHLNRLDQVLASQTLQQLATDRPSLQEVLMPDPTGALIAGSRSNIFTVRDGILCTPSLRSAGIAGVLREHLLGTAEAVGLRHEIRPIASTELPLASEVFICNSVIGVWPVKNIWTGVRADTLLASYQDTRLTHWAQELFDACLAAGSLAAPSEQELQRPDRFS